MVFFLYLNFIMINNIIQNFTNTIGVDYFLFIYAFFIVIIVIYLIINYLKNNV